jgi:hypothetical protein
MVGGAGDTTVRTTPIPSGGGAVSGAHFRVLILLGAPPPAELGEGGQSQPSDRVMGMPLDPWTANRVDDRASLKRFSVEAMWWATIFVASPVFYTKQTNRPSLYHPTHNAMQCVSLAKQRTRECTCAR